MKSTIFTTIALGLLSSAPMYAADITSPFGKNGEHGIYVFNDKMAMSDIQSTIDKIYGNTQSETDGQRVNQFGKQRYAFLFMPGKYQLDVKVGYYTQILGLGAFPDNVEITGAIRTQDRTPGDPSHPDWGPGALDNFWRSVENISVVPILGSIKWSNVPKDQNVWAVSQASPMRRVHVKNGSLRLFDIGYSSGGYLSDSIVDGTIISGSQQQWITRNSKWQKWDGSNWNMVFLGSDGNPDSRHGNDANTVIDKTSLIAEKPYIIFENEQYKVVIPALQHDHKGTDWAAADAAAQKLPLNDFYIAYETDSADVINQQLASGKNIFFTPGFYNLDKSIQVRNPKTILLGIGLTTLHPTNGNQTIAVSDVDGVKIAGLMLDSGTKKTDTMLQIGEPNSTSDHSQDPSIMYDLFCRVGGTGEIGTATNCVTINSNNVIGDNLWLWRADHGNNVGWSINKSDSGLVVNGSNVTIYGLAVEHFQKYQTQWNGEDGKVIFYQSELPYDVPSQNAWQHDGVLGYASYKIADNVSSHQAIGFGIYNYFNVADNIYADNAIETPNSNALSFQNIVTVWLNGHPNTGIKHIINGIGEAVSESQRTSRVKSWPSKY